MREIKQIMALAVLAVSVYTDIRERNIYILPLAVTSAGAVAVSLADFVFTPCGQGVHILIWDILFPAVTGLAFILITRIRVLCMGEGDGYLLACLALLLGAASDLATFAAASFFAGLYSAFLLVTKRGAGQTLIPFAPFVMAGFIFTVFYGL
ncbi:MAG: hypothetical protein IKO16_10175 [Lachnospiraceae bacterium]|nr:hypothetical protein [Lachnospiraceae bacterium]